MTEKEKQKVEVLRLQLKAAEKLLEDAQMKNIALETMIDIAEEQMKNLDPKKIWAQTVAQLRQFYPHYSVCYYCSLFGRSRQGWYEQTNREEEQQMATAIVLKLVHEIREELPRAGFPKLNDCQLSNLSPCLMCWRLAEGYNTTVMAWLKKFF
jgi:biotin synthase-like enzyme